MNNKPNTLDELTEEEFLELVLQEKEKALAEAKQRRLNGTPAPKKTRPIVKIAVWLMALTLIFNTFAIIFNMYSIPAIDFLQASSKLSTQEDIQMYKKAVVTVSTDSSKGTGFAISDDGYIITNEHVIEDALSVTVVFPNDGLYEAQVIAAYEEVDLAILKVEGTTEFPYLELAEEASFERDEAVYFIGNPLYFTGIANEGTVLDYSTASDIQTDIIMMDAPVYKGNSGSPVINKDGVVIGVVFATGKRNDFGRVGLFIPVDELLTRLPEQFTP
ncbi:S1C family serine protease [Solibacillus sp. FSL H8-0538]|uniref:S1C family serine protease n=1 Tax=Solibacillus sp. FSL H8-0538 TaxID=2921400 RepID=UPI0030F5A79C